MHEIIVTLILTQIIVFMTLAIIEQHCCIFLFPTKWKDYRLPVQCFESL